MADLRSDLERDIRAAFAGVVLGDGVSLTHAEYIDRWGKDEHGRDMTPERMETLSKRDVVDDWSRVTLADLERDNIAHMDAAGFRYYLPALMLSVIDRYDPFSMRVIGTIHGLYPKSSPPYNWTELLGRYALLDARQKRVVARFLTVLPEIVELMPDDRKVVERALARYWGAFLTEEAANG